MDPTQPPLNITPTLTGTSPYSAPNNPYQQMGGMSAVLAALKGAAGGLSPQQEQSGGGGGGASQGGSGSAPNYNQFGQQMGGNLVNVINALGGSSPAFGGGNILSGDAYGGSAANPLPGLSAADYG